MTISRNTPSAILAAMLDTLHRLVHQASHRLLAIPTLLGLVSGGLIHYPPADTSLTDLDRVIGGSGAPGIYNSSYTPDERYGEYSWCNMPHVRRQEYVVPPEEYTLEFVEVIQRHHKRTPYRANILPREDITWDCTGSGAYHHGRSGTFDSTPVYWQAQRDTRNPFGATASPGFEGSNCIFPVITKEGLEDAHQHGKDIAGVYGDLLGFLPDPEDTNAYGFRVSNNVITTQTMGAVVQGLFPGLQDLPASVQDPAYDSLEPSFHCPQAWSSRNQTESTGENLWTEHLTRSRALRDRFNAVAGVNPTDPGWSRSWDHPYDNLSAKQCHQKSLPCSVNDPALCLSQEDVDAIYRLGNWEWAHRYRIAESSTRFSALKMGAWMRELQGHVEDSIAGRSPLKYFHNFGHDTSIAAILGILQIHEPHWPGTGAEIVFELWRKKNKHFIRMLYSGQPLLTSTPLGVLDMVPIGRFTQYLDSIIPDDLLAACGV